MAESFSIGALAKAGGVGVETIRYYERRKLLQQPPRPYGRIRKYGDAHLERIQFIRRAQSAGFGLNEIESLIRSSSINPAARRGNWRQASFILSNRD